MVYTVEEKIEIIKSNPHKDLIAYGREQKKKLSMHLYGHGLKESIERQEYFENSDVHNVRKQYTISNADLFQRLTNDESMIFTTRGGATYFNMGQTDDAKMNALLANVDYNISLRKWVETFALQAYRSDPMGIIFMEIYDSHSGKDITAYPTYKSIDCIYDYCPNGRDLDYVVFELTSKEVKDFGVIIPESKDQNGLAKIQVKEGAKYYRFIDDETDTIFKFDKKNVSVLSDKDITQPPSVPNPWGKVPGFIVSDLIWFADPQKAISPLSWVVELADSFLYDRSVRDLQKKYHGFAKSYEPLLKCGTCSGEGILDGGNCPDCTPVGALKGSGYKQKTKISDVAKFPIEILEDIPGFDVSKLFGYISPDIKAWDKQDFSLHDLESQIQYTYWGIASANKPKVNGTESGKDVGETATKSLINLQPKYVILNKRADWAEQTERLIAEYIGEYSFEGKWKGASISYGRGYVLETPEDILFVYQQMLEKGAPDTLLDDQMRKYIRALYQNNPLQMHKFEKLLQVEPFPHERKGQVEASNNVTLDDKIAKRYYGEWIETIDDEVIFDKTAKELKLMLYDFIKPKIAGVNQFNEKKVDDAIKIEVAKISAREPAKVQ